MIIKRIEILSLAKILGAIYGTLGLIVGLIFSFFSILGATFGGLAEQASGGGPEAAAAAIFGALFGIGAVIVLPIFYGLMGFLGGVLVAAVYNLAARLMGGLEIEVE